MKIARVAGWSLFCLSFFTLFGCQAPAKLELATTYQVVFLDNNNMYIGKMQQPGGDFIRLTNVYYIQNQANPETKQITKTLVRRSSELHKPELMYINTKHVVMIEPVAPDSQIAKIVEQLETGETKAVEASGTGKK